MLWDNHMHSWFSGDSDTDPLEMIKAAKSRGLRGLTFTDHLDLHYPKEYGFFDLDVEDYFTKQHQTALDISDENFTVLTGIEVGIQEIAAKENDTIVETYPFDFVIGSTHLIYGQDPYFPGTWENVDPQKLMTTYYECILDNINSFLNFDSVGHLDYAFRYSPDPVFKNNTYEPYKEVVDAILEKLVKNDKALEVNTAAFRKGMNNPNPAASIIKRYHDLGGKLITIGADAHVPEDVAADFDKVPSILKECGFNEFAVFKNRKPELYPL